MNNREVYFEVTKILDTRKANSEIELNKVFKGHLDDSCRFVYYTDKADVQWVFYISVTCWLVENPEEVKKRVERVKGSYKFLSPYDTIKKPLPFIILGVSENRKEPVLVNTVELKKGKLERVTLTYTIEAIEHMIDTSSLIPTSLKDSQIITVNGQNIRYNEIFKEFIVRCKFSGAGEDFGTLGEALRYAKRA